MKDMRVQNDTASALVAPALDRKRSSFSLAAPLAARVRGKPVPTNAMEIIERLGGTVKVVGGGSLKVMTGVSKAAKLVLEVPVPTSDKCLDEELSEKVKGMGFDLVLSSNKGKQKYVVRYNGPDIDKADKLAGDALKTVDMVEEREQEKRKVSRLYEVQSVEVRMKAVERMCEDAARTAERAGGSLNVEAGMSSIKVQVEVPVETSDMYLDEDLAERLALVGVQLTMQKSERESRYVVKCSTTDVEKADVTVKKALNAAGMVAEAEQVKERKREEKEKRSRMSIAVAELPESAVAAA